MAEKPFYVVLDVRGASLPGVVGLARSRATAVALAFTDYATDGAPGDLVIDRDDAVGFTISDRKHRTLCYRIEGADVAVANSGVDADDGLAAEPDAVECEHAARASEAEIAPVVVSVSLDDLMNAETWKR